MGNIVDEGSQRMVSKRIATWTSQIPSHACRRMFSILISRRVTYRIPSLKSSVAFSNQESPRGTCVSRALWAFPCYKIGPKVLYLGY